MRPLTLTALPWRNLRGYPARTTALVLVAALMSTALLGGTLLVQGVRQGLGTIQARLGADILVTPSSASTEFDAGTALLAAEPSTFLMDAAVTDQVAAVDGVAEASPQLMLATARASCCSGRYQVIAFDPATDFTIQPWLTDDLDRDGLGEREVVVGSNITFTGDQFRLYDVPLTIVGQFAPTGSTLDNAVYTTFETGRALTEASVTKGLSRLNDVDVDASVSSVTVRVADGADTQAVATAISEQVPGVTVTTSSAMLSGISTGLDGVSRTVTGLVTVTWLIGLAMTVLLLTLATHERAREMAVLAAVGASRRLVRRVVVTEALVVNLGGALVGAVVATVLVASFRGLLSQVLGVGVVMPPVAVVVALAALAVAGGAVCAGVASWTALGRVSKTDVGLVLKEGE